MTSNSGSLNTVNDVSYLNNSLDVKGLLTVSGNIGVTGSETVYGGLSVLGNTGATISKNLGVYGGLNVLGATGANIANSLSVGGSETVSGGLRVLGATGANISNNLSVGGSLLVSGSETISGRINVLGTTGSSISNNLSVGGILLVSGSETISGGLSVVGATGANITKNLTVGGSETIYGNLNVLGPTGANITKHVNIGGNLNVTGQADIKNNTTILGNLGVTGTITTNSLIVTGSSYMSVLNTTVEPILKLNNGGPAEYVNNAGLVIASGVDDVAYIKTNSSGTNFVLRAPQDTEEGTIVVDRVSSGTVVSNLTTNKVTINGTPSNDTDAVTIGYLHTELTSYPKTTDLNTLYVQNNSDYSTFIDNTNSSISTINSAINNELTGLSARALQSTVDNLTTTIGQKVDSSDLDSYATKTYVTGQINNLDLTTQFESKVNLNDYNIDKLSFLNLSDLGDYIKLADLPDSITSASSIATHTYTTTAITDALSAYTTNVLNVKTDSYDNSILELNASINDIVTKTAYDSDKANIYIAIGNVANTVETINTSLGSISSGVSELTFNNYKDTVTSNLLTKLDVSAFNTSDFATSSSVTSITGDITDIKNAIYNIVDAVDVDGHNVLVDPDGKTLPQLYTLIQQQQATIDFLTTELANVKSFVNYLAPSNP